jgi:hypothetical protein
MFSPLIIRSVIRSQPSKNNSAPRTKIDAFFRRFGRLILLIAIIVIITTAINILFFLSSGYHNFPIVTPNPTSTPISTSDPSPTPSPSPTTTPTPIYVPYEKNYSSIGRIYVTGVKVYGNSLQGESIVWGDLYIGDSKSTSIFVESTSNVPVKLIYNVSDWFPPAISQYLNLYWDYDGAPLNPGQTISIKLTLTSQYSADFANYLFNNQVSSFYFSIHFFSTKS